MNSFIFGDTSGVFVEYVTDALSDNFENFTVFQTRGLEDAEEIAGLQFKELAYDIESFVQLAEDNSYTLIFFNPRVGVSSLVSGGLNITPESLPAGDTISAYDELLEADNPFGNPVTFAVTEGTLPDGVTLGSDGQFAGTATETGTFDITVTATDTTFNLPQEIEYSIVIA